MMKSKAVQMRMRGSAQRACIGAAVAAGVLLATISARAQEFAQSRSAAVSHHADRPYTQAELGVGMLTLPGARFCLSNPGNCTRGDISPEVYLVMLYRLNRSWAFGAGATVALPSGSDKAPPASLDRSHTRSYLMVDTALRYYGLQLDWMEGWVGGTLGAVIIKDLYKNNAENPSAPILGPQGVSVRTEGLSAGIEAGVAWSFANNWSLAGVLRSAWWFLPATKACAPTGDCATLGGETTMFFLGGAVAYRIGL
jgi:hypothetical protein